MAKFDIKQSLQRVSKKGWIFIWSLLLIWLVLWSLFSSKESPSTPKTTTPKPTTSSTWTTANNNVNIDDEDEVLDDNEQPTEKIEGKWYNSWVLFSWLSWSIKMQSMFIALYNKETNEVTFFPPDYYIGDYLDQRNLSLWNLTSKELTNWFTTKGFIITDNISIDRDMIKDLYYNIMSWDEYIIRYIWKDGKEVQQIIREYNQLWEFLTSNLTNPKILEQNYSTLLWLLAKNNLVVSEVFTNKDKIPTQFQDLYEENKYHSITQKNFPQEDIQGKLFSVDKDYSYLNSLLNNKIADYHTKVEQARLEEEKLLKEAEEKAKQQELLRLEEEKKQLQKEKEELEKAQNEKEASTSNSGTVEKKTSKTLKEIREERKAKEEAAKKKKVESTNDEDNIEKDV